MSNTFFQWDKIFLGGLRPPAPPSYRPVYDHPNGDTQLLNLGTVSFTHTKRRGVSVCIGGSRGISSHFVL